MEVKVVVERLKGCIGWLGSDLPECRYWVIAEPIHKTGICKEFHSEAEAKAYLESLACR